MQVFLSFDFDDLDLVNGFRGVLRNPNAAIMETDGSCKKSLSGSSHQDIDKYLRELIGQASVTVCLISPNTKGRTWVNRELKVSQSMAKGIVGIVLKGYENQIKTTNDIPRLFVNKKYKVYYWADPYKIADYIKEAYRNR